MFETNLNGTKLLYGAEMDGVDSNTKCDFNRTDLNELNFIELKCTLRPVHERQKINYRRYKLRNWWCQCFLARIEKIVVGTRNQKGTVDELSELEVSNIPRLVRVSYQNLMSPPAVCPYIQHSSTWFTHHLFQTICIFLCRHPLYFYSISVYKICFSNSPG